MNRVDQHNHNLAIHLLILLLLAIFAIWFKSLDIQTSWQEAGLVNLSLGFVILAAYVCARIMKTAGLPLISGYIFTGIIAGPYVTNFLSLHMVGRLSLIDDLALSFIALTAGGTLQMRSLRKRKKAIAMNIIFLTVTVFVFVFSFVAFAGGCFSLTRNLPPVQVIILGILLGVIAVARSPSSAIAIISECRARGPFTETVLGVTVVMDVLIIIFFTIALTVSKIIFIGGGMLNSQTLAALFMEMIASFLIGALLGRGIAFYIKRIGHDLPLFLLFIGFGITKASYWLSSFMESRVDVSLHLEPLLICMSAGFVVQNFSRSGPFFMETLDRIALPIFVLFFSLAGAALDLDSLRACWPLALCLVAVRAAGIFGATWFAGTVSRAPAQHNKTAWMAYLTQAGVAIGLAQLARRQFPEIGTYLITVVLAVITINQIIGPITFKLALHRVKEAGELD